MISVLFFDHITMMSFHKENRVVPFCIMAVAMVLFLYHLDFDRFKPSRHSFLRTNIKAAKPTTTATTTSSSSSSNSSLTADEVALLFKTGSTVMWRRMPIHLLTSLSEARIPRNNTLLYSDAVESIASWETIDILASASAKVRADESFQPYLQQQDYYDRQGYTETLNTVADGWGPSGGWKLDKHKFLPLMRHAGQALPNVKWYIYMEDDTYLFLENILHHLDEFDARQPWYIGSLAMKHEDLFAHGGAGFALSRAAWEQSFGSDESIERKFETFTLRHGCGDHVLGHVLKDYGVLFGETHAAGDGDNLFTWGFNSEPHWSTAFQPSNWCRPVYSWHHVHNRDVARFFALENSWDFATKGSLKYRDIYTELVAPFLHARIDWWDNLSGQYEITSGRVATMDMPSDGTLQEKGVWRAGWQSVETCEAACKAWGKCVQWSFYEDRCRLDDRLLLGSGVPDADPRRQISLMTMSGWLVDRVDQWRCD